MSSPYEQSSNSLAGDGASTSRKASGFVCARNNVETRNPSQTAAASHRPTRQILNFIVGDDVQTCEATSFVPKKRTISSIQKITLRWEISSQGNTSPPPSAEPPLKGKPTGNFVYTKNNVETRIFVSNGRFVNRPYGWKYQILL